jgi:hypothetical protein
MSTSFISSKVISPDMWNHLTVVTNKTAKTVEFYCNNELVDTFQMSEEVAAKLATTSDVIIGSDTANYLNGLLDEVQLYNTTLSKDEIHSINTFTFANNLIMKHDFENVVNGSNVNDEAGNNHGILNNPSANSAIDFTTDIGSYAMSGTAFNCKLDQYIQIDNSEIQGKVLNNCTMMAWVKNENLDTFEPILYKQGVFSFGLRNGSPILELGDGNSFHPLPAVTNMNMSTTTYNSSLTDSLIGSYNFENSDVNEGASSYSNVHMNAVNPVQIEGHKSGTIGLKLDDASYIKIEGSKLGGINMDAFTFGAWIKPAAVTDGVVQPILFRENDSGNHLEFNLIGSELQLKL